MPMRREIIVDLFAGGGGASLGIRRATGREPDVAINHDPAAIAMHAANHPGTRHYTEDVWKVHPREVTRGRPVGLLWASPDCKHFSRAKGCKPVEKGIRSLAWVAVRWAEKAAPRIIILENVREFEEWGPIVPQWECPACHWRGTEGQAKLNRHGRRRCPRCDHGRLQCTERQVPDPARKGLTFRRFCGRLRNLGYDVQWRTLNAADYGAPTHRRRLFLVARKDGAPVVWPEPTHADPKKLVGTDLFGETRRPWRTAAEIIDWSIPVPSIFGRKKPLKANTLKRIARGIKRYVLDNPHPFIVGVGGRAGQSPETPMDAPINTTTAKNDRALVVPFVSPLTHDGDRRPHGPDEPLPTVTGAHRGEHAVVTPFLARLGQAGGNGKYTNGVAEPVTTVTSKAEHLVVAPVLVPRYGERAGQPARCGTVEVPLPVVTPTANGASLVTAFMAKHFGGVVGVPADTPLPTTTMRGTQNQLVTAFMAKYHGAKGEESHCVPATEPVRTVDTQNRHQVVAANLVHMNHGDKQWSGVDEPARTVTSGKHAALVYSFLVKYFGTAIAQPVDRPLGTQTAKDRYGVVTVEIAGEPYVIVDIGMRMLSPRELARAQGFDEGYILTGSKTDQVGRIGNSVPPGVAEAIVRANTTAAVPAAV